MNHELTLFDKDNLDKLYKACGTLAKSAMIPASLRGKDADIFAILVMGAELGIKPMQALNSINVIQGKPTISPQLMIAMIKAKIPDSVIHIHSNEKGDVICETARSRQDFKDGLVYKATWNMKKADAMGLTSKDNYKKQAETMLRWRAVAEACRITFPDVLMGLYIPEEFQDLNGEVIGSGGQSQVLPDPVKESIRDIDIDFPIPPEEKAVGDLYRIQHGKLRGKQLKDIPLEDLADYREELIKRTTPKKVWELELIEVFTQYLNSIEGVQV